MRVECNVVRVRHLCRDSDPTTKGQLGLWCKISTPVLGFC